MKETQSPLESWNMGSDYYKYLHELQQKIDLAMFNNNSQEIYKLLYIEFMRIENKISQGNVTVTIKKWNSKTKKIEEEEIDITHLYSEFEDYKIRLNKDEPPKFDEIMEIRKMLSNFERKMNMLEPDLKNNEDPIGPSVDW